MAQEESTTTDKAETEFPKVQGGGSLMLAWQVRGKKVLVVGGGEVAAGRILNLLDADAVVTCICPTSGLNPEVRHRISSRAITHIPRTFELADLDDPSISLVLTAIDDPAASTQIWKACQRKRIPANIADVPPECDFYFGSVHRDGALQVMVSTNGRGPRLAAKIRRFIASKLPRNAGTAIGAIGVLRAKLRVVAPKPEDGSHRMRWMITVSDAYSWEQICSLSDEDMDNLLTFYPSGDAPDIDVLKSMRKGAGTLETLDVFDGSFGFSVGA